MSAAPGAPTLPPLRAAVAPHDTRRVAICLGVPPFPRAAACCRMECRPLLGSLATGAKPAVTPTSLLPPAAAAAAASGAEPLLAARGLGPAAGGSEGSCKSCFELVRAPPVGVVRPSCSPTPAMAFRSALSSSLQSEHPTSQHATISTLLCSCKMRCPSTAHLCCSVSLRTAQACAFGRNRACHERPHAVGACRAETVRPAPPVLDALTWQR